nr:unnamed protein product [Callosobruchus chinensis]
MQSREGQFNSSVTRA